MSGQEATLSSMIPKEALEATAQALYVLDHGPWGSGSGLTPGGTPWGTSTEAGRRDEYLAKARAALEPAAPWIAAHALEEAAAQVELRIEQIEAHQVPEQEYGSLLAQREEAASIYRDLRDAAVALRGGE
jgi:hypothetical protein